MEALQPSDEFLLRLLFQPSSAVTASQLHRMHFVGFQCDTQDDCVTGACRRDPLSNMKRCVCRPDELEHPVAMIRGAGFEWRICLKKRNHGERCLVSQQCGSRLSNSYCEGVSASAPGKCVCQNRFTPMEIGGELLCRPDRVGGECSSDSDCSAISLRMESMTLLNSKEYHAQCVDHDQSIASPRRCACPPGFRIVEDGTSCEDVNECSARFPDGPCTDDGRDNPAVLCMNTPGEFECKCQYKFGIAFEKDDQNRITRGICCENGYFPCRDGTRCFASADFCNGVPDCPSDCSDEKMYFCNFNDVYPPPDYDMYPQCKPSSQNEI